MRYWFDTEFIEKPGVLALISIGIVAEDGRTFYRESLDAPWHMAEDWVLENVAPHLKGGECQAYYDEIGPAIRDFIGNDRYPEFWGYFADYDWVLFCWLQGRMIDLPRGWPQFCRDMKQWIVEMGVSRSKLPAVKGAVHNALDDAQWTKEAWDFLYKIRKEEGHPI